MTADVAYAAIQACRVRPWATGEEVRSSWLSALRAATGLVSDAARDCGGACFDDVVIAFAAPGLFRGGKASAACVEAAEAPLLRCIRRRGRADTGGCIGIAIDGDHVCFVRISNGHVVSRHLAAFSPHAVDLVVQAIRAGTRKPISADTLLRDFGHGAHDARDLMQGLSDALAARIAAPGNNRVKRLFQEWQRLYGTVADMSAPQASEIERELSFAWRGPRALSIPGRLFVIHSYHALVIKLLAAEIVTGHGLTAADPPARAMAVLADDAELLCRLKTDIEGSGLFTRAGLPGFVEEVIYSWYLDIAADPAFAPTVITPLRRILGALSLFRTDRVTHSRDVLRDLYHGLVPGRLRQSLGEFYTPDWLVDHTFARAGNGPWLGKRILDPTCGSGAFLVAAIRRLKAEAAAAGWDEAETLDRILDAVWGFDLNPLAVQTARVNYLMEIADLLRAAPGHGIELPVLLADALHAPTIAPAEGQQVVDYRIGALVAPLDVALPAALVRDRGRIDRVFDEMGRAVVAQQDFTSCSGRIVASGLVSAAEMADWDAPLRATYDQVLDLYRTGWEGDWFGIVRNFFRSAEAGRFDHVIGNPPWVRWSKLPQAYRAGARPACAHYGVFSRTRRHGGNEIDISAMITYTAADRWLADRGRLTFVITGTVFKTPSCEGFRTFHIVPGTAGSGHLVPRLVDDMRRLRPFGDAENHTTVVVFDKTDAAGTYPVPYAEWAAAEGFTRAIPADTPLWQVMQRVRITPMEAAPVGERGSPWAVLPPGRHAILKALSGACDWVAGRKGITADLNGVYFVRPVSSNGTLIRIQSRPEAGRKDIGAVRTSWVENDLLYPLLKGAGDFEAFYLKPAAPLLTFVPNRAINAEDYEAAERAMNGPGLARTRAWFALYRRLLRERSTYRRQMQGAPFFAIYNVGPYTFRPWKVVWPEMSSRFFAAVAGSAPIPGGGPRPFVPDHKIYFAAFDDKAPAYYLCALLNAPMVREWIEAHNVSLQVGDVFKHMTLPAFDPGDARHLRVAQVSEQAHRTHDAAARRAIIAGLEPSTEAVLTAWFQGAGQAWAVTASKRPGPRHLADAGTRPTPTRSG